MVRVLAPSLGLCVGGGRTWEWEWVLGVSGNGTSYSLGCVTATLCFMRPHHHGAVQDKMREQVVFDVEDLVAAGEATEGCPYFAARDMDTRATLTLCPYSYLLDPGIRQACGIDIRGAVLVFDEAHNIEDSCREAGRCVV